MGFKLSPHAFGRFWDVHAWVGVIGGLVLYVMFLAGSITLFHEQLDTWQEPLAQRAASGESLQSTFERGLAAAGPIKEEVWFYPTMGGHGTAKLSYEMPDGEWKEAFIHPEQRALVEERVKVSGFLYDIHFLWHDATGKWPYYVAGVLGVLLLLTLVTGVLIHVKDIVRQFHQFRPQKARRVLWSDMHKVLGVMGLPFQVLYAYTGALIVLGPLVLQAFTLPVFAGNQKHAEAVAWGFPENSQVKAGPLVPVLSIDELFARARAAAPTLSPEVFSVTHHGHERGTFELWGHTDGVPNSHGQVRLREVDGAVIHVQSGRTEKASDVARRWIQGLHYAHFGGLPLRFLFFFLGLASCATILTGNWIWLARREARRNSTGNRTLARLTVGFGAGSFLAVSALFLMSRLLPLEWGGRGTAEELTFLGVLAASIAWALIARSERDTWWQQLGLAGLLLAPVPCLAARWSVAGLFGSGPRIASVTAVDVGLLVSAAALCVTGLVLRRAAQRRDDAFPGASAESRPSIALTASGAQNA